MLEGARKQVFHVLVLFALFLICGSTILARFDHHVQMKMLTDLCLLSIFLGSAVIADIAGFPDVVTLDAGGTSTDLCLIEAAKPKITNSGRVGHFPVRIPMLDIKTIGTGGGSIAWITREGHLKCGPKSAGAAPNRGRSSPSSWDKRRRARCSRTLNVAGEHSRTNAAAAVGSPSRLTSRKASRSGSLIEPAVTLGLFVISVLIIERSAPAVGNALRDFSLRLATGLACLGQC